jgi:hypothetical protein
MSIRFKTNEVVLYGGVISSNGPRTSDIAKLKVSEKVNLAFLKGAGTGYFSYDMPLANRKGLTEQILLSDTGSNIGVVKPGEYGMVVMHFLVAKMK